MMSQCNCYCEVTSLGCDTCCLSVKIFLPIFCLEIDIKLIKRGVVYSSFLLIIIFVLCSLFFQFLDRPSKKKKITMSDFY